MNGTETDVRKALTGAGKFKPRVALMGEFSAGKSTLSNLLLGSDPLPVRVTSTNVPPVWVSYGEEAAILIRQDGTEETLKPKELSNATLEMAKLVRLTLPSEILCYCDLLDIPGISDPNLEHDVWNDLIDEADCVIWCTHATQAWRQSEASAWEEIRGRTVGNNLLLVTQFDKLKTERDRARVLARLAKETNGAFKATFPVALIEALEAGDDEKAWKQSGADEFVRYFMDMVMGHPIPSRDAVGALATGGETQHRTPDREPGVRTEQPKVRGAQIPEAQEESDGPKILPKRVSANPGAQTRRRPASSATAVRFPLPQPETYAHGE